MPKLSAVKPVTATPHTQPGRLRRLGPLILFAGVVSLYAPSVQNDFIYDDVEIILAHQAPRDAGDWARIFKERHFPNLPYYRPVTRLTLLGQKRLHGDLAWPFHLVNVLLMGVAALLAYAIMRLPAFGVAPAPALLASALFAAHPAASSCVYPICSGRETLLPAVWMLGAMYAYLRGWSGVAMLAFAGALFSKEQAIVTPALFLLADVLALTPNPPGRSAADWVRRYWPVIPIAAAFFAIRFALFGGSEYAPGSPLGPLLALLYALQTTFAPTVALVYEPTVPIWLSPVRLCIAAASLVAIVFLARRNRLALRRTAWFWLGWLILTLLPTANLLRQEAHYDERYVFLASLAVFAIGARMASQSPYLGLAAGVLLAAYAIVSVHRSSFFHDDVSFSRQWIRTNPESVNAHYNLAFALAKQGRIEEAAPEYMEALRIRPDYAYAHCNLANALSAMGRLDEAMTHYREALRLNPDYSDAHKNFGVALGQNGQFVEAIREFREVLRLNPNSAAAHNDIGAALASQSQYRLAALEFSEALRLDPTLADAHNNLGNVLVAEDKLAAAAQEYREALRIEPGHAEARRNLSIVEAHLRAAGQK